MGDTYTRPNHPWRSNDTFPKMRLTVPLEAVGIVAVAAAAPLALPANARMTMTRALQAEPTITYRASTACHDQVELGYSSFSSAFPFGALRSCL
jgi:hypothetical protein